MTKIALISDIHGDYDALRQSIDIVHDMECRKIICLGDVLDEGADNGSILKLLKEENAVCIRGNHEELEQVEATPEVKRYLDDCHEELTIGRFHFCHTVKRVPELSIKNAYEAWNIFDEFPWKVVFIGHNHLPAIFVYDENTIGESVQIEPAKGISFVIGRETRCIVSVGSLAYGRDYFGRKSFVIFDSSTNSVDFHFICNGSVAQDMAKEMLGSNNIVPPALQRWLSGDCFE